MTARKPVRIAAVAVLVLIVAVAALMPFINSQLTRLVTRRIAAEMTVPGAGAPAQITLGGGWLLPQVLTGKLSEVHLSLPDATMGCVRHAAIAVTLRGVSQSGAGARADRVGVSTGSRSPACPPSPACPARPSPGPLTGRSRSKS